MNVLLPSLLCTIAKNGVVRFLAELCKEDASIDLNACNYDGRTALHVAAREGHL